MGVEQAKRTFSSTKPMIAHDEYVCVKWTLAHIQECEFMFIYEHAKILSRWPPIAWRLINISYTLIILTFCMSLHTLPEFEPMEMNSTKWRRHMIRDLIRTVPFVTSSPAPLDPEWRWNIRTHGEYCLPATVSIHVSWLSSLGTSQSSRACQAVSSRRDSLEIMARAPGSLSYAQLVGNQSEVNRSPQTYSTSSDY